MSVKVQESHTLEGLKLIVVGTNGCIHKGELGLCMFMGTVSGFIPELQRFISQVGFLFITVKLFINSGSNKPEIR